MIKLIYGGKGAGKTKKLVEGIHEAAKTSRGVVICIEKGKALTYDVDHTVRLINVDDYKVDGAHMLYGFVAGLLACNYDITHVFMDDVHKMTSRDLDELGRFLTALDGITQEIQVELTLSAEPGTLPESVEKFARA